MAKYLFPSAIREPVGEIVQLLLQAMLGQAGGALVRRWLVTSATERHHNAPEEMSLEAKQPAL